MEAKGKIYSQTTAETQIVLPLESHGYAARESTEHTLFEMVDWFDKHVKNAKPR